MFGMEGVWGGNVDYIDIRIRGQFLVGTISPPDTVSSGKFFCAVNIPRANSQNPCI